MVRRKSTQPKRASAVKRKTYPKSNVQIGNKIFSFSARVLKEIAHLQRTVHLLMPKASFARLVREIMQGINENLRIQSLALRALHEATEVYMVHFFEDSNKCSMHARRATLMARDMQLVKEIRSSYEPNLL